MRFRFLLSGAIATCLVASTGFAAKEKEKVTRKPANEVLTSAGITKEMRAAIEKHWMFKAIRSHYKTFDPYAAELANNASEDLQHEGDRKVSISYSTYNERERNSEDSVVFEAAYDSKEKRILHMTVYQGPCLSDMCGP